MNAARPTFPFTAIVGQEEMKLALLLNVIAPSVGGVLIEGHRGTAKSTAVRSLADLLPQIKIVRGCAYNCDPSDENALCDACIARLSTAEKLRIEQKSVPVVELPLGATEDRVCGTVDIARALKEGVKVLEPGLLARANRGFLYIDEVNLLEDHLVDVLLDVAATGRNHVEREGVSAEHPSRFVLVGSGNPEEGELRPQLLDRFGLCAEVETVRDIESRVLIVEHREAFDRDPSAFNASRADEQSRLRRRILKAKRSYESVRLSRSLLRSIAELCLRLGVDGHRGEITITRAARALAAFEQRKEVSIEDVRRVAPLSLRHRLRRDPLEHGGGSARVENSLSEIFGEAHAGPSGDDARLSEMQHEGRAATRQPFEEKKRGLNGKHADIHDDSTGKRSAHDVEGRSEDENGRGDKSKNAELIIPTIEVRLDRDEGSTIEGDLQRTRPASSSARRRGGARKSAFTIRGRYSGASDLKSAARSIALDATLRAASAAQASGSNLNTRALTLKAEDLRFKRFRGKAGALYIFLVDTSGSMAANRIGQAKGTLTHLLRRSYINRDRVSLVSFRGRDSELLLAPTGSVARARVLLDALPVGGSTPLAAGLLRALDVARGAASEAKRQIGLVIFTDGRANVPLSENGATDVTSLKDRIREEILGLGASIRNAGVSTLVIDTQSRFTSGGEGQFLSDALGGRYVRLPLLISGSAISEALKTTEI
jgi:magnesium chelatase subunit D